MLAILLPLTLVDLAHLLGHSEPVDPFDVAQTTLRPSRLALAVGIAELVARAGLAFVLVLVVPGEAARVAQVSLPCPVVVPAAAAPAETWLDYFPCHQFFSALAMLQVVPGPVGPAVDPAAVGEVEHAAGLEHQSALVGLAAIEVQGVSVAAKRPTRDSAAVATARVPPQQQLVGLGLVGAATPTKQGWSSVAEAGSALLADLLVRLVLGMRSWRCCAGSATVN